MERRARFWGFLAMFFESGLFAWSSKGGRRALGVSWILGMDTGRELWAAGLRRALPAPAQGIYPLRIPLAAAWTASRFMPYCRPLKAQRPLSFPLATA